jgi:hypothetical protein
LRRGGAVPKIRAAACGRTLQVHYDAGPTRQTGLIVVRASLSPEAMLGAAVRHN